MPKSVACGPVPCRNLGFYRDRTSGRGNLNAKASIVQAAVLYVLRLLVDEDIPLNEGALRAVQIVLPTCLLNPQAGNNPAETPAVAAGTTAVSSITNRDRPSL